MPSKYPKRMIEESFIDESMTEQSFPDQLRILEENSEAWALRFSDWVEGHRNLELPSLSDESISRESIYEDRSTKPNQNRVQ